jgi:hypothetical protein
VFEADFFLDFAVIFAIGLWPLLLVLAAAAVRWANARRHAAAAAMASAALPHVAVPALARRRTLAYAGSSR